MGRGTGASNTGSAAVALRGNAARPQFSPTQMMGRAVAKAVWNSSPSLDSYIGEMDDRSAATAAGRGNRLYLSVRDLLSVPEIEDPQLAATTLDNALWHAGRLSAQHDTAPGAPLHSGLSQAFDQHLAPQAQGIVDTLHARGVISDDLATEWSRDAAGEMRKAYLGKSGSPSWAAVRVAKRASDTREGLLALDISDDSPLAVLRDRALADCDNWIGKAVRYSEGQKNLAYQVTKDAPGALTRGEAVLAALSDPKTRASNMVLNGPYGDAHQALADEVAKTRKLPTMGVTDERWLQQAMNYQTTISHESVGVDAVSLNDYGIMFAPHVVEDVMDKATRNEVSRVWLHERIHQGQPRKVSGSMLSVEHYQVETALLEASTTGVTNDKADSLAANPRHGLVASEDGRDVYAVWDGMLQGFTDASGVADLKYRISAAPINARGRLLAETILGRPIPTEGPGKYAGLDQVMKRIAPIVAGGSTHYDSPAAPQWAAQRARELFTSLAA